MSRNENIEIFRDTETMIKENRILTEAVGYSVEHQTLVPEYMSVADLFPTFDKTTLKEKQGKVTVSGKRTLEAAEAYKDKNVCVHNFASATNPGGGVTKGSTAQEECLCRCSTLYPCLNISAMWNGFYGPHRAGHNPLHNDDCIYTPDVVVLKTDKAFPKHMEEKDWYKVNVVTCAAPNLRPSPGNAMNPGEGTKSVKITDKALFELHKKRLERILDIALAGENDVVILGAFGCGAFQNNPEIVALAAKEVVKEYRKYFDAIEFAVYCSPRDDSNYRIFKRVLGVL